MNYFGLDHKYIKKIIDDNPMKVGKYVPGVRVKIISNKNINKKKCVVIFAWNMFSEIKKENIDKFKYFINVRDLYSNNFIKNFYKKYS